MEGARLPIEVEVGPRFEIFYALHKLFAPTTPKADRWRKSARTRLGSRLRSEAQALAPEPLMWAILADLTLGAPKIGTFQDLTKAIEGGTAGRFRSSILTGVPRIPGSNLAATFERLLSEPEDYRARLLEVLRGFWERVFSEDFAALQPELNRLSRQLLNTSASVTAASAGERLGIPIKVDAGGSELSAGRGGYSIPLSRVGRVLLIPSAFNLNRWWTKRDDGEGPVDFYFPLNDGTIVPNDALSAGAGSRRTENVGRAAQPGDDPIRPEVVFRALGDTTRYAIASILAREPATPSELSRRLKVSKPTITHHVHALRDAGLIVEGTNGGKLGLDRSRLEKLSGAAVSALFASEGKLKLTKTRKNQNHFRDRGV